MVPARLGASRRWAGADLRSRWLALLALGVLAGVTAGVALAALAGAVRTDTALDRLRSRERGADAIVFASQSGVAHPDWSALASAPEVDTVAPWALGFGAFEDPELQAAAGGFAVIFTSVDGRYLHDTNRPVVVAGRMYDPDAPDEVVIDENVPADQLDVGDTFVFDAFGADQEPGSGAATGPHLRLKVVGRVETLAQFLFVPDGQIMASPALNERYGDQMSSFENADVRLVHGGRDADWLQRTVNRVIAPGTPILDLADSARRVQTTTAVERTALLALAGAIAVVGLVLIGQALGRSASVVADDADVLRGIGMTSGQVAAAAVLPHLLTAGVAVVTAVATAVVASVWFPVGTAGRVDPDRGLQVTWRVLIPGVAALVLLLLGATAALARLALRPARPAIGDGGRGLVGRFRRVAPLSVGMGATMALRTGAGRARVAVRPALVGAVVGVLGVTAAMTIDRGLDDAVAHPERAGVVWDLDVSPLPSEYTATGIAPDYLAAIDALPGVAHTTVADRVLLEVDGIGVPTVALRPPPAGGPPALSLALTGGRAPDRPDEAAIGPHTAHQLGVGVGDTVTVGDDQRPYRVVGEALFPSDVHSGFDDGLWVTDAGLDAVVAAGGPQLRETVGRGVAVNLAPGASVDRTLARLQQAVGDRTEAAEPAAVPPELANLRDVRTLPVLLAVFLAVVAVAALAHVLVTSARRRRREFAVLRALGVTGGWMRSVLNSQGSVVALVGLAVGVPLGIALGRVAWELVAERVPLTVHAPFSVLALVLVVPVTVLVANAAALWPGRRVARQRPAAVLRTE